LIYPKQEDYIALSRKHNLIPVTLEIPADMETPISVYLKVSPSSPSFLLESVEGGEKLARYSIIGFDPFLTFQSCGAAGIVTEVCDKCDKGTVLLSHGVARKVEEQPLQVLAGVIAAYSVPDLPGLPRFYGGAVGYLGYDAVRGLEKLPENAAKRFDLPDAWFVFPGTILVFDHVRHSLKVIINTLPGDDPQFAYDRARNRIAEIEDALGKSITSPQNKAPARVAARPQANMSREEFITKVKKAKEYITAGDVLQVVLSQRFQVPFRGDPFHAYRRLRAMNPSPYLYYLNFGEAVVVGSSPEMLVRVEGNLAETCPIAGTRPRGKDAAADRALAAELLADEKERAEHLMLVDLGRNDLGRVCLPGTVRPVRFMDVEKYSHVMHIVSSVQGQLAAGKTCFDALAACFPAGTVSGAPKVRAMEIIEELEPDRRGIYAGAVGYLGFSGNLDTAIAIRTVLIHREVANVQAGAGIVADSVPEAEYEETLNKARALLNILEEDGS
jgi:anthranilate synthase component 1